MRIGIQLPEVERPVTWNEIKEIAIMAEDGGLDSIWIGDHLLYRDEGGTRGPWEAWSMLAALSEATERVELGPLVAATAFHAPAMLAKKAAAVDEISGGRLILGLGAGWNEVEFRAFGFPFDHRVARFEEAYNVITTLIREGSIDFSGKYYELREMELVPAARPDMKVLIGSNGPRMMRIAAPSMDMWNTWFDWFGNRPEGLLPLVENLERACAEVGRDATTVEKTAAVHVQLDRGLGRKTRGESRPGAGPISGSHEDIANGLAAFSEAGISHIQVVLDPIDAAGVAELVQIVDLIPGDR